MASAAAIAAWDSSHVLWFGTGDNCVYYALLSHRPLYGHNASEQRSDKRQNEQQPLAEMPCLNSHTLLLPKRADLLNQNLILRYFIMIMAVNGSDRTDSRDTRILRL